MVVDSCVLLLYAWIEPLVPFCRVLPGLRMVLWAIGLIIISVIHVLLILFNCLPWMSFDIGETLPDFIRQLVPFLLCCSCGSIPSYLVRWGVTAMTTLWRTLRLWPKNTQEQDSGLPCTNARATIRMRRTNSDVDRGSLYAFLQNNITHPLVDPLCLLITSFLVNL